MWSALFTTVTMLLLQADAESSSPLATMDRSAARQNALLAVTGPNPLAPEVMEQFGKCWTQDRPILDAVVESAAVADPRIATVLEAANTDSKPIAELTRSLGSDITDPFLRANVATYLGRELVRRRLFDEGLTMLGIADVETQVDPATLLFHRAACEFALHQTEAARQTLDLLEKVTGVPSRYETSAAAMRSALESMAPESLAGIAHDMKDVQRRLDLKQADQKVLTMEQDILARLDKLIEDMENEGKDDSSSADGKNGGMTPTKPAEESRLLGGKGEGKVDDKTFDDDSDWGNLPDKERERALQEVGRDFPGHYRDAIEQYFRRLATPQQ